MINSQSILFSEVWGGVNYQGKTTMWESKYKMTCMHPNLHIKLVVCLSTIALQVLLIPNNTGYPCYHFSRPTLKKQPYALVSTLSRSFTIRINFLWSFIFNLWLLLTCWKTFRLVLCRASAVRMTLSPWVTCIKDQ